MVKNVSNAFRQIGATNITKADREENDFYATEPKAVIELLKKENFNNEILEPCCGKGHISSILEEYGYKVKSTDIIDRGYEKFNGIGNVFDITKTKCDIITNPPYKDALKFTKHLLSIMEDGRKLALFLKIQFLEGKARKEFFNTNPPKRIYVSSGRLRCSKNGEFDKYKSSAICYAWFVWEKGYKGLPTIDWIN